MSADQAPSFDLANPSIVDLFAGPGGLDVAAHWLGVPVVGVEWDDDAYETRKAARLDTHHKDVRDLGPWSVPKANVLAGGPPCQTFTVAGSGTGRKALDVVLALVEMMEEGREAEVKDILANMEDERTGLVLEPLRWALKALDDERPYEAIVLEQVPAVRPVWDAYAAVLERKGYGVDVGVLRTEQFGVPQTRRRAILIARRGREVKLPTATHRAFRKGVAQKEDSLLPWVSMGDVFGPEKEFEVISNYGTGGIPSARGRRKSTEPAFTVTGKISRNRVIGLGPSSTGRFEPHHAGQLQTFPSNYPWRGKDWAQQVGNAIPPRLAVHVLASVLGVEPPSEAFLERAVTGSWWDHVPCDSPLPEAG
ncbi:DNA cytosine methyltransferase [Rhodococcus sp. PvR099]|uniref:DNA cytosine methyltransferase n=1 Tax=Rhodococcus sp. PvR099 TaxID=2806602 RepID=UPI001AE3B9CA|nr:DNA cytosine methyltransferase [Rhodococcus sp. PvR099]MBP1159816.1 DNA (cytosine-5)-methyltransferase 1 [Rhodococcus sp. PvR099]